MIDARPQACKNPLAWLTHSIAEAVLSAAPPASQDVEVYPNAKFLWSHRDPANLAELGAERLTWWAGGIERAMDFRRKFGDDRFVDVSFGDLQTDSVSIVARSYAQLRLTFSDAAHAYGLADCGLTPGHVREAFSEYSGTYDASA